MQRLQCNGYASSFPPHSSITFLRLILIHHIKSKILSMAPKGRKKTDIPIPEPRHRVGPKGVSSGISFRELPPPSLDEIKKVCEHYQTKCAGTYNSLASRYVYQMATEIEDLVDSLEGGYTSSEGSLSTIDGCEPFAPFRDSFNAQRCKKRNISTNHHLNKRGLHPKRGSGPTSSKPSFVRPPTRHSRHSKTGHDRKAKEIRFEFDHNDSDSCDVPSYRGRQPMGRQKYNNAGSTLSYEDVLEQHNLEDQVEQVLGWLKEEMERSQSLVLRSRQIHDAELANAKRDMERLKKAAKRIIKAVHKKGKAKAARSEATAESERRRRLKSQQMMASMIKSQAAQMEHLKRELRHSSKTGLGFDLEDDSHAELFSLSGDSDLTSILDGLAEEAYRQSCYSH